MERMLILLVRRDNQRHKSDYCFRASVPANLAVAGRIIVSYVVAVPARAGRRGDYDFRQQQLFKLPRVGNGGSRLYQGYIPSHGADSFQFLKCRYYNLLQRQFRDGKRDHRGSFGIGLGGFLATRRVSVRMLPARASSPSTSLLQRAAPSSRYRIPIQWGLDRGQS